MIDDSMIFNDRAAYAGCVCVITLIRFKFATGWRHKEQPTTFSPPPGRIRSASVASRAWPKQKHLAGFKEPGRSGRDGDVANRQTNDL